MKLIKADEGTTLHVWRSARWHKRAALLLPLVVAAIVAFVVWIKGA